MSDFAKKCYAMLKKVPSGKVVTYAELASAAGRPHAQRAVGTIMKNSPNDPTLPCHRVVKSTGEVGEFLSGKDVKIALLLNEGIRINNNRINLNQYHFKF